MTVSLIWYQENRDKPAKTISCRIFGENKSNNNYTEEADKTESIEELEKL